eukprot:6192985-Alexandrium_andersonii.AAC.1
MARAWAPQPPRGSVVLRPPGQRRRGGSHQDGQERAAREGEACRTQVHQLGAAPGQRRQHCEAVGPCRHGL